MDRLIYEKKDTLFFAVCLFCVPENMQVEIQPAGYSGKRRVVRKFLIASKLSALI